MVVVDSPAPSDQARLEYSLDGAAWVDMSGFVTSLSPEGAERAAGAAFVHAGDWPLLGVGKQHALRLNLAAVYTRKQQAPYDVFERALRTRQPLYLRWSPHGAAPGLPRYTTGAGLVHQVLLPYTDAATNKPVVFRAQVEVVVTPLASTIPLTAPVTAAGLLLSTSGAGCYYSAWQDDATTLPGWIALSGGLVGADLTVVALALSPAHGDRAYLCTSNWGTAGGTVWRNDNVAGGGAWTKLTLPAPTADYAGGTGYAWSDVKLKAAGAVACPTNAATVYALVNYDDGVSYNSYWWLYRSLDAGVNWTVFALGAAGQGRNLSISPVTVETAYISFDWLGRERIYRINSIRTGNPPTLTSLVDSAAVQVTYALATPALESWWVYGQRGTRHEVTAITAGTESYNPAAGLVVESNTRARMVSGNVGAWFSGTDDGATQTVLHTLPRQCTALAGRAGRYFLGVTTENANYAAVYQTVDDGQSTRAADTGIPGGYGGITGLGIFYAAGDQPVSACMSG